MTLVKINSCKGFLVSLFLFQRKIILLIFYTAVCQHHLEFCLICMGLHNILNEVVLKEKKNQFLFKKSKVHQYLFSYML